MRLDTTNKWYGGKINYMLYVYSVHVCDLSCDRNVTFSTFVSEKLKYQQM